MNASVEIVPFPEFEEILTVLMFTVELNVKKKEERASATENTVCYAISFSGQQPNHDDEFQPQFSSKFSICFNPVLNCLTPIRCDEEVVVGLLNIAIKKTNF